MATKRNQYMTKITSLRRMKTTTKKTKSRRRTPTELISTTLELPTLFWETIQ